MEYCAGCNKALIAEEILPGRGLNPGLPNETLALYPLLHKLMLKYVESSHSKIASRSQGCQIFVGTLYQNGGKYTKSPQNIPCDQKMYLMGVKYT
jgi:hypothetical protein